MKEVVKGVNSRRILWFLEHWNISVQQFASETKIAESTIERLMDGRDVLTVKQLKRIAEYFNQSMLFFLCGEPISEQQIYSPQFRTIMNQEPVISRKVKILLQNIEWQRKVYLSLLDDLGEDVRKSWYPDELDINDNEIKHTADLTRSWLGLERSVNFNSLRKSVESKGIWVVVTNGYLGRWHIAKDSLIRGFCFYHNHLPVIVIRKQNSPAPQAFTLFHELAHLLFHKRSFVDDESNLYEQQGNERIANEFAGNVLVPDRYLDNLNLDQILYAKSDDLPKLLEVFNNQWCASTEVILRRLRDEQMIPSEKYSAYRNWTMHHQPSGHSGGRGRFRDREPIAMFGVNFVGTVISALQGNQITLAKASSYLDNLKISDLRKLERRLVHS